MSEWQPIETAPTDGTEVFVGWEEASVWIVRGAAFSKAEDWTPPLEGAVDGWWSYRNSVGQDLLDDPAPTHWHPMPKPPIYP